MSEFGASRRRESLHPNRPVTPEVAGSSPVAPVPPSQGFPPQSSSSSGGINRNVSAVSAQPCRVERPDDPVLCSQRGRESTGTTEDGGHGQGSLGFPPMGVEPVSRGEHELDLLIRDEFFPGVTDGAFIDVGAARPDYLSMSALFRGLGWRVIAIEPNTAFCQAYREAGLEVLEYACGEHDEDDVPFEVVDSQGVQYEGGKVSFESFSALKVKRRYRWKFAGRRARLDVKSITVDLRRLDTILAEHAPNLERVDIVSVDVEGWEAPVLDGFSLERYLPRVLVVENLLDERRYRRVLRRRGYDLWRRVGPNDVYVPVG